VRVIGVTIVLLTFLATWVHLFWWFRAKQEVVRTREDVRVMEARLDFLVQKADVVYRTLENEPSPEIIQWLIALERSGVTREVDPTEVLAAIDDALPVDARVLSLRLKGAPPDREMTIEAVADNPRSAADFVAGLSGAACVLETEILEERHLSDGGIMLRIGAGLASRGAK
jgi:hypothetical protein